MGKAYVELLKDPRWQRKRLEILSRDNFTCRNCGDTTTTLEVDHLRYGKTPWDVEDSDLRTLCHPCHERMTGLRRDVRDLLIPCDEVDLMGVRGQLLVIRLFSGGPALPRDLDSYGLETLASMLRIPVHAEEKLVALVRRGAAVDEFRALADACADEVSATVGPPPRATEEVLD